MTIMNDNGLLHGTLIRGIGSFYTARDKNGALYELRCKKKFRHRKMTPMIGDEVLFEPGDSRNGGWIEEILPRKTVCLRPPVANVSCLVVVLAPVPEPDMLLTDRQISRAVSQGMDVIIAVNKADLDPEMSTVIRGQYQKAGIPVVSTSTVQKEGLEQLKQLMGDRICCLTGQSGVGKSSILNALLGLNLETGSISRKIDRGKNTTRTCELIEKDGLRVMDTAGFNLLEPEKNLEPEKLKERYPDFAPYEGKCRFRECLHDREPGCAVQAAAEQGKIHPERLRRYRLLLQEIREEWRERYD